MNKHDFYKELMSEYTFDAEKIRTNAKKGKYAKQKISPMAIGFTAAVAACTVACGTLAFSMLGSKGGVDLVDTGSQSLSALSSAERVRYAIEQQNKEQNSEAIHDVLVTFTAPVASAQAKAIIAEYTDVNIPVKAVYLADGSKVSGSEQVADIFGGDHSVSALCIQCAGSAMSQLQNAPEIFLVELMSEADFDTALPMDPDEVETVEAVIPDVEPDDIYDIPEQSTSSDNAVIVIPNEEENTVPDDIESIESSESTESTDAPDSTEAAGTTETVESTESTEVSETVESTGSAEAPDETVEPIEPEPPVITEQLPEGVVLPINPEAYVYETQPIKAQSAYFVTDEIFFAITEDSFALYGFHGGSELPILTVECSGAVVHWVDDDGGRLIVSGIGENGMRNKLWLVDANSKSVFDLKAEDTVMDGTLAGVGYNEDAEMLILNVKQYGEYYVAALALSSTEAEYINVPFDTKAKVSLLGYYGSTVYLAVTDASLTQIYAVDVCTSESRIINTYDNRPEISKNYAFTHGLIIPSDTAVTGKIEIFDSATESFIETDYFNESIVFGVSKHSFYTDDGVYTIANGTITQATDIKELAKIDWRKSLSNRYAATVTDESIKITESVYSDENLSAPLAWGKVESQCTAELSAALNGAVGVNNVLALMQCKEAGIKTPENLNKTLAVFYTENAAAQLKTLCDIPSMGLLTYGNGGLNEICADKTELVISSNDGTTAAGTLYIKIGSICGTTAYRIVDVQFLRENGSWKLDTIIGK